MAPTHTFVNILQPGRIGLVRTRNRMIKTGASMLYWRGDETRMNGYTLGYYDAKENVPEVYTVGDCAHPNMIIDAVRSGWETAKEI